jgi:hypothetical protein
MKNYILEQLKREYYEVTDEISNLEWLKQYGSFPGCVSEALTKRLTGRSLEELEVKKKNLEARIRRHENLQMA